MNSCLVPRTAIGRFLKYKLGGKKEIEYVFHVRTESIFRQTFILKHSALNGSTRFGVSQSVIDPSALSTLSLQITCALLFPSLEGNHRSETHAVARQRGASVHPTCCSTNKIKDTLDICFF